MSTPAVTSARALRDKAEAMLRPSDELAFATDATSQPGAILLAIARPHVSCVIAIDKAEYSGIKTAEMLGFHVEQPKKGTTR